MILNNIGIFKEIISKIEKVKNITFNPNSSREGNYQYQLFVLILDVLNINATDSDIGSVKLYQKSFDEYWENGKYKDVVKQKKSARFKARHALDYAKRYLESDSKLIWDYCRVMIELEQQDKIDKEILTKFTKMLGNQIVNVKQQYDVLKQYHESLASMDQNKEDE